MSKVVLILTCLKRVVPPFRSLFYEFFMGAGWLEVVGRRLVVPIVKHPAVDSDKRV